MSATDIATSIDVDLDLIYEQTKAVAEELIEIANMKPGQILVVGCSSGWHRKAEHSRFFFS